MCSKIKCCQYYRRDYSTRLTPSIPGNKDEFTPSGRTEFFIYILEQVEMLEDYL